MNAYKTGSLIGGQYEVVVGPVENPRLQEAFGLVYLCADHGEDDRAVALKTFRPEYLSKRRIRNAFLAKGRSGWTWASTRTSCRPIRWFAWATGGRCMW